MEYVVVRRVERAKVMITSTREPLAEVALACGSADRPHLNRRFRDIVGVSPGQWRRSNACPPESNSHRNESRTITPRDRASAEIGRRVFA